MLDKLKQLPLFRSVGFETLKTLTENLPYQTFKTGDFLIRQGEPQRQAYLLNEGRVEVFAEPREGIKTTLVFLEAPSLIGEMEVLRELTSIASVVALEPCSVLIFSQENYLKMLQSNHQICFNLVQMLSQELYEDATSARMRLFGRVEHLVANTLCSFAKLYGENHAYGVLVRKDINKSEIAEILGVARRSVIRAFEQLESEKLIQVDRKQLIIPDLTALQQKASSPFP